MALWGMPPGGHCWSYHLGTRSSWSSYCNAFEDKVPLVFVDGYPIFTILWQKQYGCHFPHGIFNCIFLNENVWITIKISLKFVSVGSINNISALVQIMACANQGASHYRNQWWLDYWRIYVWRPRGRQFSFISAIFIQVILGYPSEYSVIMTKYNLVVRVLVRYILYMASQLTCCHVWLSWLLWHTRWAMCFDSRLATCATACLSKCYVISNQLHSYLTLSMEVSLFQIIEVHFRKDQGYTLPVFSN